MRAVFKNEFSSLFHKIYAYVYVSIMLFVSAILFSFYNLSYANENILSVISALSLVAVLLIPIIAISVYPNKKRVNTDMLYDNVPLTSAHIVFGKYFAALAVLMLPNVLLMLFPMIAGMFGPVDHMVCYSAFVGLVLFEAALLAVIMFVAAKSRSKLRAYIWSYAIIVIWYLSSPLSTFIPNKSVFIYLKNIISAVSIFDNFSIFISGIFSLSALLFYVGICVAFLFLSWREYEKAYTKPHVCKSLNFKSAVSLLTAITITACSLILPLSAQLLPEKYTELDATGVKKNTVSDEAERFLSTLDDSVTIYLLESTGAVDYELYLQSLADTNKNITFTKIYYENTPEFYDEKGISIDSISANSLIIQSGDIWEYLSYYNLFYYSNSTLGMNNISVSDYNYYSTMFSQNSQYAEYYQALVYDTVMYFDADNIICTYIEYITTDIIPTNYYLIGHGETNINGSLSPYYDMGLTELSIAEAEIPQDAASIFINKPTSDINDVEKQKLIDYLGRGGQLTFITNEANLDMPNLCAVLAEYGMSAQKGFVQLSTTNSETSETTSSAKFSANINTDNDVLYYMDTVGIVAVEVNNSNAIKIDTDKEAQMKLTKIPMLTTTDKAFIGDDSSTVGTYNVACAIEAPNGAKIAWFTGDGYNSITDKSAMLVMCALGWVTLEYESNISNIPAVQYTQPITPITSGGVKLLLFVMLALPIVVLGYGMIMFYKRKKA